MVQRMLKKIMNGPKVSKNCTKMFIKYILVILNFAAPCESYNSISKQGERSSESCRKSFKEVVNPKEHTAFVFPSLIGSSENWTRGGILSGIGCPARLVYELRKQLLIHVGRTTPLNILEENLAVISLRALSVIVPLLQKKLNFFHLISGISL